MSPIAPAGKTACTRQIITDEVQPQRLDNLRGLDRDVADALVDAGFDVAVRACAVPSERRYDETEPPRFPVRGDRDHIARLSRPIPPDLLTTFECVVFAPDHEVDWNDEHGTSLAAYVLDEVSFDRWVIRDTAAATYLLEVEFADGGIWFGNMGYDAYFYTLAALEVTRPSPLAGS